jgi:hypothetical protein
MIHRVTLVPLSLYVITFSLPEMYTALKQRTRDEAGVTRAVQVALAAT